MRMTCLIFALTAISAAAEEKLPPAVAAYVDDQTLLIGRVDLARLDLDKMFKHVVTVTGDEAAAAGPRTMAKGIVADLRKAGVSEVYVTVSAMDLTDNPTCLILPAGDSGKVIDTLRAIPGSTVLTIEARKGAVIAAMPAVAERMKSVKPTARPDLAAALADGKTSGVQIAVALTADLRRVIEETMPNLPKELGGGSIQVLTRGLTWAALSLNTTPKLDLAVVVQASDAATANRAADLAKTGLKAALKDAKPSEFEAYAALATKMLTPQVKGDRLISRVSEEQFVKLFAEVAKPMRIAASRQKSVNNLKMLGLAMHNYLSDHSRFPADIVDKNGKALLSWRVHLLPYLEQDALHKQFKLDEPWDSATNKPLIAKIPAVFVAPEQKSPAGTTTYLSPLGDGYFTRPKANGQGLKISEITDGTSNTIMIVETADGSAIEWTKPGDWAPAANDPMKALLGHYANGTNTLFVDGSVRFINANFGKMILLLLTYAGGEAADAP